MLQKFNEANRDILININGALLARDEAGISPFDSAVQGGDAVWEGLRVYQGRIFKLTEHLDRLHASAQALSFDEIPSHEEITAQIRRTLAANAMTDAVHIRLTLTRGVKITSGMDPRLNQSGPTLIVLAEHKDPVYEKTGLRLITSSFRRCRADMLDPRIHHANLLNSILAKIEANLAGVDDAVMLDDRGFVAETNATHLFLVQNDTVRTSHVRACPDGITRATVLGICDAHQISSEVRDLELDDFYQADEVFCTGTMGELAAVVEIDGRSIGSGACPGAGSMVARMSHAYSELTSREGCPVA